MIEQSHRLDQRLIRFDGVIRDVFRRDHGYWEAKDQDDKLEDEIAKKFAAGYPNRNILFEDSQQAILYQHGERVGVYDLNQPEQVAQLLNTFFSYTEPMIEKFDHAVDRFRSDAPELANGLKTLIVDAHKTNKAFKSAFTQFHELCQKTLNSNLSPAAVDEMLIQHLLTEHLMRTVFDNPDFARRNAIASEVEKVIDALTSQSFSRKQFLGQLDYFYEAIEQTASIMRDFSAKQRFINTVYERFFQGYAVKVADTHGIVYTPQEIVDFMFVDQFAFSELRKHLLQDFTQVYYVDLHGNMRQNPKISGTSYDVFGIQVGVGITIAIRSHRHHEPQLFYYRVPEFWRREEKLAWSAASPFLLADSLSVDPQSKAVTPLPMHG